MSQVDREYFALRAAEERDMAAASTSSVARAAHEELAHHYGARVERLSLRPRHEPEVVVQFLTKLPAPPSGAERSCN